MIVEAAAVACAPQAGLWASGACFGSQFLGGVIGNLAASLLWDGARYVTRPLTEKLPDLASLLSKGGHDGNHHLLRALRCAECETIATLAERAILDLSGTDLRTGSAVQSLALWLRGRKSDEIVSLLEIRAAFRAAGTRMATRPVAQLEKFMMTSGAKRAWVDALVQAGSEIVTLGSPDEMRLAVVKRFEEGLDDLLRGPRRMNGLGDTLEPLVSAGIPESLLLAIRRHPGGYWDALRLAFREILKSPTHEAALKAWTIDVTTRLDSGVGGVLERLDDVCAKLDEREKVYVDEIHATRDLLAAIQSQLADLLAEARKIRTEVSAGREENREAFAALTAALEDLRSRLNLSEAERQSLWRQIDFMHAASGHSLGVLTKFLADVGRANVAPQDVCSVLVQVATEWRAARARAALLDDAAGGREAEVALERGDAAEAERILYAQAAREAAEIAQLDDVRRMKHRRHAATLAALAAALATQLKYRDAASLYTQAATQVEADAELAREYRFAAAEHLRLQGVYFGDDEALGAAIEHHRALAASGGELATRAALQWARALRQRGEREPDGTSLDAAVAALRNLESSFDATTPDAIAREVSEELAWALLSRAERGSDGDDLDEAERRALLALEQRWDAGGGDDWCGLAVKVAAAFRVSGERRQDTERLVDAERLLRIVLEPPPADSWTHTLALEQLGHVLLKRHTIEPAGVTDAELEEAAECYRQVAAARPREIHPLDWGGSQSNLCAVLHRLARRSRDPVRAREAVDAGRAALDVLTPERSPRGSAAASLAAAGALRTLGSLTSDPAPTREAVEILERARAGLPSDARAHDSVLWLREFGAAQLELGSREQDVALLRHAARALDEAAQSERYRDDTQWFELDADHAQAYTTLGALDRDVGAAEHGMLLWGHVCVGGRSHLDGARWRLYVVFFGAAMRELARLAPERTGEPEFRTLAQVLSGLLRTVQTDGDRAVEPWVGAADELAEWAATVVVGHGLTT